MTEQSVYDEQKMANDTEIDDYDLLENETRKFSAKYAILPQMYIQKKLMIRIKDYMEKHPEMNRKMTVGRFFNIVSRDFLDRKEQEEKDMQNPKKKTLIEQSQIVEALKEINQKIGTQNPVSDIALQEMKKSIKSLQNDNQILREILKMILQKNLTSQSLLIEELKKSEFAYGDIEYESMKKADELIENILDSKKEEKDE